MKLINKMLNRLKRMSFALALLFSTNFGHSVKFTYLFVISRGILVVRVVKVSHSTRTAILQLVDPACGAAQEQVETKIWNFHFFVSFFFCQVAARAHIGRCGR